MSKVESVEIIKPLNFHSRSNFRIFDFKNFENQYINIQNNEYFQNLFIVRILNFRA